MKPDIKKYLNTYLYLQEIYNFRKKNLEAFSYGVWAKELGASDKSYVRLMVLGKRHINVKMTEAFALNIDLQGDEKEYFINLVRYTQCKTQIDKDVFGRKLISLLKNELDQIEIEQYYDFLSNPLLPRLQVMLSFHDVEKSPKNLSWILGISEDEVLAGIRKLEELKLIDSNLKPLKKSFKVQNKFGDLALESFLKKNLDQSKEAFALPKETRRYRTLFLPLNEKEFADYLDSMQQFGTDQVIKYNPDHYAGRRLYQVHLNIIPVSEAAEVVIGQPV